MSGLLADINKIPCPVERTLALVGSKWSLLILWSLYQAGQPVRYNQLLKTLKPMSSKTLSAKLKDLESYRIISKNVIASSPPGVEYSLTERGLEFSNILTELGEWSQKWY